MLALADTTLGVAFEPADVLGPGMLVEAFTHAGVAVALVTEPADTAGVGTVVLAEMTPGVAVAEPVAVGPGIEVEPLTTLGETLLLA